MARVVELGGVVHQVGLDDLEEGKISCDGQASDQVNRWLPGPVRLDLYVGPVVFVIFATASTD